MSLYKDTESHRILVTKEARVILKPETEEERVDGGTRNIQVIIPPGSDVALKIGVRDDQLPRLAHGNYDMLYGIDNMPADPDAVGRVQAQVVWPVFPSDNCYCFSLRSHQWLAAAACGPSECDDCTPGESLLTLIVEYTS